MISKLVPPKNDAKLVVTPNRTMNAGRIAMKDEDEPESRGITRMKLLLVAANGEENAIPLGYHLKPLGFTLEHFTDPVAVIERLEEIDPQAILFNAGDFPRHWKPLLKLAREKKPRKSSSSC